LLALILWTHRKDIVKWLNIKYILIGDISHEMFYE
jgi:hypothetical protein